MAYAVTMLPRALSHCTRICLPQSGALQYFRLPSCCKTPRLPHALPLHLAHYTSFHTLPAFVPMVLRIDTAALAYARIPCKLQPPVYRHRFFAYRFACMKTGGRDFLPLPRHAILRVPPGGHLPVLRARYRYSVRWLGHVAMLRKPR